MTCRPRLLVFGAGARTRSNGNKPPGELGALPKPQMERVERAEEVFSRFGRATGKYLLACCGGSIQTLSVAPSESPQPRPLDGERRSIYAEIFTIMES